LARNAREEELARLYQALVCVNTAEQAAALLDDVCTKAEINEMAQRLEVAFLLDAGESYLAIQEKTGSSPTTIARVSKSLNYGPGGYRHVINAANATPGTDAMAAAVAEKQEREGSEGGSPGILRNVINAANPAAGPTE
jgi:TrpR-related protein YerC/YecD